MPLKIEVSTHESLGAKRLTDMVLLPGQILSIEGYVNGEKKRLIISSNPADLGGAVHCIDSDSMLKSEEGLGIDQEALTDETELGVVPVGAEFSTSFTTSNPDHLLKLTAKHVGNIAAMHNPN